MTRREFQDNKNTLDQYAEDKCSASEYAIVTAILLLAEVINDAAQPKVVYDPTL